MDISPAERLTGANIDSPGTGCVYGTWEISGDQLLGLWRRLTGLLQQHLTRSHTVIGWFRTDKVGAGGNPIDTIFTKVIRLSGCESEKYTPASAVRDKCQCLDLDPNHGKSIPIHNAARDHTIGNNTHGNACVSAGADSDLQSMGRGYKAFARGENSILSGCKVGECKMSVDCRGYF
jgi:hypothetical protein